MINNLYLEEKVSCPQEVIYTRKNLPIFNAPYLFPDKAFIEDKEVSLPVLMKDGSIDKVSFTKWKIYAEFEGNDRHFNPVVIANDVEIPDTHTCVWVNENYNSFHAIYAKPSFPVKVVCVDRNYNAEGLYLLLRED